MDPEYRERDFAPADWEEYVSVRRRAGIDQDQSALSLARDVARLRESALPYRQFLVEDRRTRVGVGFASVYREPVETDRSVGWVQGLVDPAHRRRGIGAYLYDRVSRAAGEIGFGSIWTRVPAAHETSLDFLRRRGFAERERSWESVLDLSSARPAPVPRPGPPRKDAGIEYTTWARERPRAPGLAEAVLELTNAVAAEIPRPGGPARFSGPQFRAWVLENPSVPAEAIFLARDRDRYVGLTYGQRVDGDPQSLLQQFTGVRREYRGRGIGTDLKLRLIDYARGEGIVRMRTFNDGRNNPILRVNRRLGFRRVATWVFLERPANEPGAGSGNGPGPTASS